ncbi:MAG: type II toxin-antitoxin system PemK/MazF family toxin [Propionibacteriaceae bacterium]|nr:type II toxin-antitoxin system PemK/MazF family toxin [Propionibacteriaceae bacterium]
MAERAEMRRGDIVLANLGSPKGHEAGFVRPVLILSAERFHRTGLAVAIPITRAKRDYPTHVEINAPLPETSYAQCEHLRSLSTNRIIKAVGQADPVAMLQVELKIREFLGL